MLLKRKNLLLLFFLSVLYNFSNAQNNNAGTFSGSLEANGNFFQEDVKIGATQTPQYDHQLFGADAWLDMKYSNFGFDFGLRFDLFNNSNLLNPQDSYNDQGIGRWFVKKKVNKLGISVGHLYDQIGSGIIFRAYEERPLLIDNALMGVRLTYDIAPDWEIKAFTGRQRNLFDLYASVIKGASIDGFIASDSSNWSIAPGIGIVNRTIDDETMNSIVSTLSTYSQIDRIGAKYNAYAFTIYNTLTMGPINWYVEAAYKTNEVLWDPLAEKLNLNGTKSLGKFIFDNGSVFYTSIGYAGNGFGATLDLKRTQNFSYRVNPFEIQNRGAINFLPPMTRVNTYRLNARYSPATQELGEQAMQLDLSYAPSRKLRFLLNFSSIQLLKNFEGESVVFNPFASDESLLYKEIYTEVSYKYKRKWQILTGIQFQNYNQAIYEGKADVDILETLTPYVEYLYKFDRKKSIRIETQYMITAPGISDYTNRDLGDWLFAQVEVGVAPHWIFTISDMYNIDPYRKNLEPGETAEKIHYPTLGVVYTQKSNRFELKYVKQVEGIVCAGGICRLEPAFSGVKMSVRSTF